MTPVVTESRLPLPRVYKGKVRDIYEVDDDRLLLVASDRVSAFDVVMEEAIPRKGEVLTQISAWWLSEHFADVAHHAVAVHPDEILELVPELSDSRDQWAGRATLVRRTEPVLVECVVRGYLAGSAWQEYRVSGTLAGQPLPPGLMESSAMPAPVFSPATKAQEGHDENITFEEVERLLGRRLAGNLRARSLDIYERAASVTRQADLILADTKFEFGLTKEGSVMLIDEVLTPDSSRFWPQQDYVAGGPQPSLDKQPIRDYLDALPGWDKNPPPPALPAAVVDAASERYMEVFKRLTGIALDNFTPPSFSP